MARFNKFDTRFNFRKNWVKISCQILILIFIITAIETIDYFYVATWWGAIFDEYNNSYTLNLQLPVDKVMPWFTPIFPFYIAWPFMWFAVIPLFIYFSGGKHSLYRYFVNALIMYVVSFFIYALIPTTCTPSEFIKPMDGTTSPWGDMYNAGNKSWDWGVNAAFQSKLIQLAGDPNNIWGSAPSFHNYWAATFVFFALHKHIKNRWRVPMIIIGVLISLSTLLLHQHNFMDVVITYTMLGLILIWESKSNFVFRFETWYDKLFKLK